jgi:hypothetical protein
MHNRSSSARRDAISLSVGNLVEAAESGALADSFQNRVRKRNTTKHEVRTRDAGSAMAQKLLHIKMKPG